MSGKKPRRKGYRGENELEHLLKKYGIDAKRVPLSGASEFQKGDLIIRLCIDGGEALLTAEVKRRRNGFKQLYGWLEDRNLVFMRADRKDWIVAMDIEFFLQLMRRK